MGAFIRLSCSGDPVAVLALCGPESPIPTYFSHDVRSLLKNIGIHVDTVLAVLSSHT